MHRHLSVEVCIDIFDASWPHAHMLDAQDVLCRMQRQDVCDSECGC